MRTQVFRYGGYLYRRMTSHERFCHDERRREQALRDCHNFLHPVGNLHSYQIGDTVRCQHVHLCQIVILEDITLRGMATLATRIGNNRITCSSMCIKEKIEDSPPLEELLTSDFETLRKAGLNRIAHEKLKKRIIKMNKERRIKLFMTRNADLMLEYVVPVDELDAFSDGSSWGYYA